MRWPWNRSSQRREKGTDALMRRYANERPEALPSLRERALTPPLSSNDGTWCDQQQSSFFTRLPKEIRHLIYQEVLAPADRLELHVVSAERRLLSRRCVNEDPALRKLDHPCWGHYFKQDGTTTQNPNSRMYETELDSGYSVRLGLLRSCRQVYSESIDILYSYNVFSIRQTRTVVDLQRTILPQRFHRIRALNMCFLLELYWYKGRLKSSENFWPLDILFFWESAWNIVAGMKSLQSLQVELLEKHIPHQSPRQDALVQILKPMTAIHLPTYIVTFDWHVEVENLTRLLEDKVPFQIRIAEDSVPNIRYW